MAQKCTHCGKKYGRQLKSCPFCSNNSNQDRLSLENFFNNVEIKFEGELANKMSNFLLKTLDDIVQRLPNENAFKSPGTIYFSTLDNIVKRRKSGPIRLKKTKYLQDIENAEKEWKNLAPIIGNNPDNLFDIVSTMREYPDGICFLDFYLDSKDETSLKFDIDIVIDHRIHCRNDDYIKGVIIHELVEYSTKYNVLEEHNDEVTAVEDIGLILKKYLKSGYYPPSKEYDEHEKIVNQEVKRLGFEKEISIMEKYEFTKENIQK